MNQRASPAANQESLVRAVVEGTTVKDRRGRVMLAIAACARLLRLPKEAVVGRDDSAFLAIEEAPRLHKVDEEVMRTGQPRATEERLTIAGATRVHQGVKAPYRDNAGGMLGIVGIARDVTAQKSAT